MPKVSVIVPVYNTEKYLPKCLDSLTGQTLKDIEIICINDASTDNSLAVLKEYADKDDRIKIIDFKENKGAATARNQGIDEAQGEYVGFVDSDDFVDLDFYEKLYTRVTETGADVVKGSYKYPNGFVQLEVNKKIQQTRTNFVCEYCSAIFKRDFIKNNKIYFPILSDMEDPVFAFKCALLSHKIDVVDFAFVNICERNDSQTRLPITLKRLQDKVLGLNLIVDLANENNIDEMSYSYICAVWFGGLFLHLDGLDEASRIFIRNSVERLWDKIRFKKEFLEELGHYDSFLESFLEQEQFYKLTFFNELRIIHEKQNAVLELQKSNELLEKELKTLQKNYEKELKNSTGERVCFITAVNNYDLYNQCVGSNVFVLAPPNIECFVLDNVKENTYISVRYNQFLDNYDYTKEGWFVFCHADWELMEDINPILQKLDKNNLYGAIGSRAEIIRNKVVRVATGQCYERRRDGSGFRLIGNTEHNLELADTFDCQVIIVHSSLINKYHLRFDEKLPYDLYVEDFCIAAKKNHNILSYTIPLKCCHWSGYHTIPISYWQTLAYINTKYPEDIYDGTVSLIGGKNIALATPTEILLYHLRKNIKKGMDKSNHVE